MLEQHANGLRFWAFYTASGVAATGLTVTVRVWRNTTLIVTDAACTELASGQYYYDLAAASVTIEGDYRAVFHTAGTVDTKDMIAAWWVDKAGIEAQVLDTLTDAVTIQRPNRVSDGAGGGAAGGSCPISNLRRPARATICVFSRENRRGCAPRRSTRTCARPAWGAARSVMWRHSFMPWWRGDDNNGETSGLEGADGQNRRVARPA